MLVKDYQKKYLLIEQEGGDYNAFTSKVWWELGQKGDGKFSIGKYQTYLVSKSAAVRMELGQRGGKFSISIVVYY